MSAEKAIFTLLKASTAVTAIVGTRIMAGIIPQGTPLPAVAYNHISTVERNPTLAMNEAVTVATSRIEVAAQTKDYPTQKALLAAIRAACRNKQGVFNGITVDSVLVDTIGPDLRDDEAGIYMQTIDFKVTFKQPN
ncbi:MAG: DUF3168 domain-containing protein [Rhodocyclaceae bacterium]|nr:DUF3168 domain-containing protein [Rhodocyclaceae bacterium]